jgi:hypothetical protein
MPSATGQLKLLKTGNACASVEGDLDTKNVAIGSTVHATSTQHGREPENAVNGFSDVSYWASAVEQSANATVDFTIDFGVNAYVELIEIVWEMPAKSFELKLGSGGALHTIYSTETNSLNKTLVATHGEHGRFLQIRMHEAHSVWSSIGGGFAYAINNIRIVAGTAHVVAADCTESSEGSDARDKFSAVFVPEFNPVPADLAKASAEIAGKTRDRLAGLLAELTNSLRRLDDCKLIRRKCTTGNCTQAGMHTGTQLYSKAAARKTWRWTSTSAAIVSQLGVDNQELHKVIDMTKSVMDSIRDKFEG